MADSAIAAGGHATELIPSFPAARERQYPGVARMIEAQDMLEVRMALYDNADAFISLPDGIGTLEETVEIMRWITLGIHAKSLTLVDSACWSSFLDALDHMEDHGFSHCSLKDCVDVINELQDAIVRLA